MVKESGCNLLLDVNNIYSTHFNVGRLAMKLPEFLRTQMPKDMFAYELCLLETAISQLADFPETTPLELKHLEGITPEKLMESVLYPRIALFGFEEMSYFVMFTWFAICGAGKASLDYVISKRY